MTQVRPTVRCRWFQRERTRADLIREHARALADRLDGDREREESATRLLDYYQHTATLADAVLGGRARATAAQGVRPTPAAVPAVADAGQALAWVRAERATSSRQRLPRLTAAGERITMKGNRH